MRNYCLGCTPLNTGEHECGAGYGIRRVTASYCNYAIFERAIAARIPARIPVCGALGGVR